MQESKKERTVFGTVTVKDPQKVIQLAVVVDDHKVHLSSKLWEEGEKKALVELAHIPFDPKDIFYSEQMPYGQGKAITCLFRYYTPIDNRVRTPKSDACAHGLGGTLCEVCHP